MGKTERIIELGKLIHDAKINGFASKLQIQKWQQKKDDLIENLIDRS